MHKFFTLLLVLCGIAIIAHADETVKIFDNDRSESPSAREWKFTVPAFGVEHQVRLGLDARIDWKTLAGSNPWMRVAINGNFINRSDLLNKPDDFKVKNGLDLTWSKGDRWRVIYSPDFEAAFTQKGEPFAITETDPYHYVWDITRYVKPGENEIRIINLQVLAQPTTLVLRNAQIEVGKPLPAPVGIAVEPAPTGPLSTYIAQTPRKLPLQVRAEDGLLRLSLGSQAYEVSTRTSLPAGQWNEADAATRATLDREPPLSNGGKRTLKWATPRYAIERHIEVLDNHIHIADTFTNSTQELVGVMVEHRLPYPTKPEQSRVAGSEVVGQALSTQNGYNPTVFAQWKDGGIGLVAEDDIFRVHIRSYVTADEMGIDDWQLGIEPGKPVTLEWDIYPVQHNATSDGDYWEFVNTIRQDWDVNYTIPGPFIYVPFTESHPAQWYGDWAHQRDVKIVCGSIAKYANGHYAHGTGIMFAPEFVAHEKDWVSKLHQTAPEVKSLCYFHAQISTEPDGETKYAADREKDNAGKPMSYPYDYPLPMYLPTKDSVYGKALWGYVHTCLDDIKADGLYWDEMSHSVLEETPYGPWDGHTVIIDPKTHEITGKTTSVPLVMQPLQLDIVHYLRDHDKYLMANTQPMTRTMMREKIVRFVETGTYYHLSNTHLGCPLGLGNHHAEDTQSASAENVRRILKMGAVYYGHIYARKPADWNFTSVMYPITPTRLGPGFVIGKERIHTTVSGRFGFPDGSAAAVYVVDVNGARVAAPDVKEVTENGKRVYNIRIPSDQFAILVKK